MTTARSPGTGTKGTALSPAPVPSSATVKSSQTSVWSLTTGTTTDNDILEALNTGHS